MTASVAAPVPVALDNSSVTDHEQGLMSFARYLDASMLHKGDAAIAAYERLQQEYGEGLEAKIDVAKTRFSLFLKGTITHMKGITRDPAANAKLPPNGPPTTSDGSKRFVEGLKRLLCL